MTNWISVKDRLPEKDGKYLILIQKRHVICTFYKGYFYKSRAPKRYYDYWLTNNKKYSKVTHWMPLPEAPNDEQIISIGNKIIDEKKELLKKLANR